MFALKKLVLFIRAFIILVMREKKPDLNSIKFTPFEWEMLTHRPDDAIVEVLVESFGYDPDEVWERLIEIGALNHKKPIDLGDPLTRHIIEDMIDGNTWLENYPDVDMDDKGDDVGITDHRKFVRTAKALEKKVGVKMPVGSHTFWKNGKAL